MLAKILSIVAAFAAAVQACDNAGGLTVNPMTAPSATNWPTIGQPFTVEWSTDYANKSPIVTLSLYQVTGTCPGNECVELADIAGWYTNNGSFTWTPSNSLTPGNNYALLFINENPCLTVWGAAFGIHPEGYTGGAAASGLGAAAAALVTNEAAAPAATGAAAGTVASSAAQSSVVQPAAAQSSVAQSSVPANVRYTTVYTTTTMVTYYSAGATSAAASGNPSVTTVMVTDTVTVYETPGAVSSGFSLGASTTY